MHKSWCMPVEAARAMLLPMAPLLGTAGKWCACRWAVVQLDYDEEMGRYIRCMDRWRQNWRCSAQSRGRS